MSVETKVVLTKTDEGYATKDGRWTLRPSMMGGGVTGWAGGRGWSNGKREWLLTDTTGTARLGVGGSRVIVDTLWRARDIIAHAESAEERRTVARRRPPGGYLGDSP